MNKLDEKAAQQLLANSHFFGDIHASVLSKLAKSVFTSNVDRGTTVYNAGEVKHTGIFLLINGNCTLNRQTQDGSSSRQEIVFEGEVFNIFSIFYDEIHQETLKAASDCSLLFVPKTVLLEVCAEHPNFEKILCEIISAEHNRERLRSILVNMYSDGVDPRVINQIINSGKWIDLPNNSKLFSAGDPSDSMYFLVRGLLKAFISSDNYLTQVGEINEGEAIGEMGIISGEARSASIYSGRASTLFQVHKEKFDSLMKSNPSVLYSLSKQIISRFSKKQVIVDRSKKSTVFLTMIPMSRGLFEENRLRVGEKLKNSLNSIAKCYYADSNVVNKQLNINDINEKLRIDHDFFPLENFITRISYDHRYILLQCDFENTFWTKWCLSISDNFIFALDSKEGLQNTLVLNEVKQFNEKTPSHLSVEQQLIICHEDTNKTLFNTNELLNQLKPITQHHHVGAQNEKDLDRIARLLTGTSIGIALGGGGARGVAHIGVYKALIELGIPIDVVCGTSMGAMMAGCIASGLSPTEILAKIEEVSNTNFLKDYDLPYSSILNPKSYELAMQIYAGSSRVFIEDLWIPMFCCATNLSKSHLEVIDAGLLWKAIRASGTVPGVHPPMVKGKSLLVDGGLINNLPGDILLKKFGGKLLSVNVSPEADLIPNFDVYPNQKNYAFNKVLLKNMFRKDYLDLNVPTIVNIMLRSIMVGSSHKSNEVADLSDVYLRPPVFHFAMGDLHKAEEIAQIGYEYTINKLNRVPISDLLKKRPLL